MKLSGKALLLIGAGAVLLLGGGGAAVAVAVALSDRERVRKALRDASLRHGLDPDWLDAIGKVETGWKMNSRNLVGPDGARGGSYGPTQISQKTARAYGYTGTMEALTQDPDLAAEWSATILAAGKPRNLADAVAWWNAGRYHADKDMSDSLDEGEAPAITVGDYWPKAVDAYAFVQDHPLPVADGEEVAS